mmetsp:Transcript_107984/g.191217  ORF Transcript_107984/g.191217 Transcript_107984/m.191217 type:complete len:475 (-) Transcript_107984:13-1437(-)
MGLDRKHLERYMKSDKERVAAAAAHSAESWGTIDRAADEEKAEKELIDSEEFSGPSGSSKEAPAPPSEGAEAKKQASATSMATSSGYPNSSKVDQARRIAGALCEENSAMGRARQLASTLSQEFQSRGMKEERSAEDPSGKSGASRGKEKNSFRSWIELGRSRGVRPEQFLKSREGELQRNIKNCLKQVGFEDTHRIVESLTKIELRKAQDLELVVKLLFDAALTAPHDCEVYADIAMALSTRCPEFPSERSGENPVTFPRVLLNTCQQEYESMPRWLKEPQPRDRKPSGGSKAHALIRFLGSLFVRRLAAMRVIGTVLQDLIGAEETRHPEELEIDCACELLIVVGSALEANTQGKQLVETIANRLTEIKESCLPDGSRIYSEEVQTQIEDVLELSRNNWIWSLQVVIQLEDDNKDHGMPRISCRSLSGEECASVAGQLCYARASSLRAQIADQLNVHPSRLRMLKPDSSIFE